MRRNNQAGQALVIAALGLTVLLLAAGLAVDMGYLRYEKRRLQTAADSAALAGAAELPYVFSGANSGPVLDAAHAASALNGFQDGDPSGTLVTASAPTSGPHANDSSYVQVLVSQAAPTFFMRIVGISSETVTARAVATLSNGPGCMYALSNSSTAIQVGNHIPSDPSSGFETIVAAPGCGIVDNGELNVDSAISHTVDAKSIVATSYDNQGTVSPTPVTGATGANPLAYLDGSAPSDPPTCSGQSTNYQPGVTTYPCGLTIDAGTAGASMTLNPGLYTIGGSGLSITGNGGSVTGNGVTFYVDGATAAVNINSPSDDGTGGNWGAVVQFVAPSDTTAGGIPGVVLFQNNGDSTGGSITLSGFPSGGAQPQASSYLWGAIYMPNATLMLKGTGVDQGGTQLDKCSSTPRLTEVVAYQLDFQENLNFDSDDCQWPPVTVSTVTIPNPIKDAVLVE